MNEAKNVVVVVRNSQDEEELQDLEDELADVAKNMIEVWN